MLGSLASSQVIVRNRFEYDRAISPLRQPIIHDDAEEIDDDVKCCAPENLLLAVEISINQAGVLRHSAFCAYGRIDLTASEGIVSIEKGYRYLHQLLHFGIRMKTTGTIYETSQGENRPPEEVEVVRRQRTQETYPKRGKTGLFPCFTKSIG